MLQELAEQYEISVVPTFVAFKGEDRASSFTLLMFTARPHGSPCRALY